MTICENFPLEKLRIAQFVKIFPLENNPLYGTFVCHNEIRDITAEWLDRVYHVVVVELPLQPLILRVRILFQPLLIGKMMLELIYMLVDSGVAGKVPFSM